MAGTWKKCDACGKSVDMIHGPMLRPLIAYSVPIMLPVLPQRMFGAAAERFAGAGLCSSLCPLMTELFIGLTVGAGDCGSASKAAHPRQRLSRQH